ncbi:hypothetical protein T439DRAFT_347521 [Meredithblackwellia eburnea MCA 4105]
MGDERGIVGRERIKASLATRQSMLFTFILKFCTDEIIPSPLFFSFVPSVQLNWNPRSDKQLNVSILAKPETSENSLFPVILPSRKVSVNNTTTKRDTSKAMSDPSRRQGSGRRSSISNPSGSGAPDSFRRQGIHPPRPSATLSLDTTSAVAPSLPSPPPNPARGIHGVAARSGVTASSRGVPFPIPPANKGERAPYVAPHPIPIGSKSSMSGSSASARWHLDGFTERELLNAPPLRRMNDPSFYNRAPTPIAASPPNPEFDHLIERVDDRMRRGSGLWAEEQNFEERRRIIMEMDETLGRGRSRAPKPLGLGPGDLRRGPSPIPMFPRLPNPSLPPLRPPSRGGGAYPMSGLPGMPPPPPRSSSAARRTTGFNVDPQNGGGATVVPSRPVGYGQGYGSGSSAFRGPTPVRPAPYPTAGPVGSLPRRGPSPVRGIGMALGMPHLPPPPRPPSRTRTSSMSSSYGSGVGFARGPSPLIRRRRRRNGPLPRSLIHPSFWSLECAD